MENYWQLGKWAGIPVSLHWTVLLSFPWLFLMLDSVMAALIASVAFFGLLVAHEFGHVAVARARGVRTDEITLYGVHGQTVLGLRRTPLDEALIAWGGIGAQLALLIAAAGLSYAMRGVDSPIAWAFVTPILLILTKFNAFVMVVALLPIGPMDGSRAWQALPMLRDAWLRKRRAGVPVPVSDPESKVVHLTPAKRRELELRAKRAADEVIRDLGSKK